MRVYYDDELREVLYTGWGKWLEENGKQLKIRDGSNISFHLVMATWDNYDTDDRRVAVDRKSRDSSEDESSNPDDGYDTDRCGRRGRSNWRDLKSMQHGGQTFNRLMEEESNNEFRVNDDIDKERDEMCKKSKKNNMTDEHKRESVATYQRTSPKKGCTESPVSPVRRSGRSRK